METLFDGIPLDKVSTSMTINGPAIILLCFYVAAAEKQGVSADKIQGTVQNDILKEYMAQHAWCFPIEPALRLIVDGFAWCAKNAPHWNTISISGYHIREAGSTAVQEIAFTLANGIAYVDAAMKAGLEVNAVGQRLSFFFNCHNDFLEEIAKFRAARRLWAHIMRDRFGATNPRAQQLRFHTQTAGSTLTAQQPENNIVRVALQALAAVLGGTQSLHCNALDEALSLPSEDAARVALRTQQIIAAETGVANAVDPVGGAFMIEAATDRLEAEARALLDRVDRLGGTLPAIESGMIQREIQDAAYRAQQAVDAGRSIVVGVNRYVDTGFTSGERGSAPPESGGGASAPLGQETSTSPTRSLFRVDPDVERQQIARVRAVRASRSDAEWRQAIAGVEAAARGTDNLLPPILAAVEARATLGEISDAMRRVFGEYTATEALG